ncbi:MAG: ribonuclease [Epsilonproteobacteria bacterium]|nr:ribonuclease [Campylobacterota bacterium]
MPENLQDSVHDTLNNINKGTKPSGLAKGRGQKWGSEFKNNKGQLPKKDTNGKKIIYQEYDVVNVRDSSGTAGIDRVVVGSDGKKYYTGSHYGNTGDTAFLEIK